MDEAVEGEHKEGMAEEVEGEEVEVAAEDCETEEAVAKQVALKDHVLQYKSHVVK
jgi:hypothetical protein